MTDRYVNNWWNKEVIREVPSNEGIGNIVLWILIVWIIWLLIWGFSSGRINFSQPQPVQQVQEDNNPTNNPAMNQPTTSDESQNIDVNVNYPDTTIVTWSVSGGMNSTGQ